jgi:hypothetical protein
MSGFADEYQQQRAKQTQTGSSANPHEEKTAPASSAANKPSDAVLTRWRDNVCSEPDAPVVCDTSLSPTLDPTRRVANPVPAPFNVPLPGQYVAPPHPLIWKAAPPLATCPTETITGGPAYDPKYRAENLEPYKVAFSASWSEATTSYNALVTLHRAYKDKEKDVIPLLQLDASRTVGAGVQGIDASKSFDGATLKPSLAKLDSSKLSPDLRAQIFKARDKITLTEFDIANKQDLVKNANASLLQATNQVEIAANKLQIVKIDTHVENLQLDKDHIKRDVEDFKAKVKATVESVKTVTAIINCWSSPDKVFANVVGAVNQGVSAGGAIAEAAYTVDANARLSQLDGQIRSLKNEKGALLTSSSQQEVSNALLEVSKKVNETQIAVRTMEAAKLAKRDAYREMSALIDKAGAANGLNSKDRRAVAGAVEAMPKIDIVVQQLQSIDEGLEPPPYNDASGIGATMASNVGVFTHAVSVLKGNRAYVGELKAMWEARRSSVMSVIDQSVAVTGEA